MIDRSTVVVQPAAKTIVCVGVMVSVATIVAAQLELEIGLALEDC